MGGGHESDGVLTEEMDGRGGKEAKRGGRCGGLALNDGGGVGGVNWQ